MTGARLLAMAFDYPDGYRLDSHHHDRCQVLHASAGVMRVHTEDATWIVPAQRAVWLPAGLPHAIRMSGPVSMRTLYLKEEVLPGSPGSCQVIGIPALMRELILRSVEVGPVLLDRTGRPGPRRALVELLLDELTALLADPLTDLLLPWPRDPRLQRVAEGLVDNPADGRNRS